jgi:hypothetical protein
MQEYIGYEKEFFINRNQPSDSLHQWKIEIDKFPTLKGFENSKLLMNQVIEIRHSIHSQQQTYNNYVEQYNNMVHNFPHSIYSKLLKQKRIKYWR